MRRILANPKVYVPVAVATCLLALAAFAASPSAQPPAAEGGAVQVASASATAVPTSPMGSRNAIGLVNLGPNPIYCGWASTVTTATGFPVPANGGTLSVDVAYNGSTPKLYCITTALQVTPADTRWMEVR